MLARMKSITKAFPGVLANDHVDFEIEQGIICGLLGENGAGKTTLMNVLYGLYRPDEGEIYIRGEKVEIESPLHAIQLGIGMVHQQFMLVPPFTVTENIALGLRSAGFVVDFAKASREVLNLSRRYGLKVNPEAKVQHLSVGEQQRVEILNALYRGAELLILDEPTSVLTPQETQELFAVLRSLAEQGKGIVFISHKLGEIIEITDRVTVLRDGKAVFKADTSETNRRELARHMVGREVSFSRSRGGKPPGSSVLEVRGLTVSSDEGLPALKGVSFAIRAGEILGLAGVDGNGQLELAEALTGLRSIDSGSITIDGQEVSGWQPRDFIEHGVGHIPEDRLGTALIVSFTVARNTVLKIFSNPPFLRASSLLNFKAIDHFADRLIQDFDIRVPSRDASAGTLSGGNQQKLVLARELSSRPRILIGNKPTRGLDIAATEYVHQCLLAEKDRGAGVLLISADLDEIMQLSDRIGVIYEGRIMDIIPADQADIEEIGLMMAGSERGEEEYVAHGVREGRLQ